MVRRSIFRGLGDHREDDFGRGTLQVETVGDADEFACVPTEFLDRLQGIGDADRVRRSRR
jgi:hypothetical protein